jgi:hypothetical protein
VGNCGGTEVRSVHFKIVDYDKNGKEKVSDLNGKAKANAALQQRKPKQATG